MLVASVMMSTVTYLPLFAQSVIRATPTQAGMTVAPMLVGWPVASAISGRLLVRFGYRPLIRAGFLLVAVAATTIFWFLRADSSLVVLGSAMFVAGMGLGTANTSLMIAVQESVPWRERGVATASTMFFRTIGGSLAIGGLGAVLAAAVGAHVSPEVLNRLLGPERGRGLDPVVLATLSGDLEGGCVRSSA